MKQTRTLALRQLGALDPALQFPNPQSEATVELRIERILTSARPDGLVDSAPVRRARLRAGIAGFAVSLLMAIVAVMAWASPAQGVFTSHAAAVDEPSTLQAGGTSPRTASLASYALPPGLSALIG
jgi:hypothetical protein